MLSEQEIYDNIINNIDNPAEVLVNKANEMGGYDNITVVIMYNN